MAAHIDDLLARFRPISLADLNERAALQRRVDNKYLLKVDALADLLEALREDHLALEIDERRCFSYESVYFDTPELLCYWDHVEGGRPRAKIRSRLYIDTETCFFEAKLKSEAGETAKEHIEQSPADHGRITAEARAFLREVLQPLGDRLEVDALRPALTTRFERFTLAAENGSERVTCDLSLRLSRPEGDSLALREGHALVEAKSEDGDERCDRLLAAAGIPSISFSKYRVGTGLLVVPGEDDEADGMAPYFTRESESVLAR